MITLWKNDSCLCEMTIKKDQNGDMVLVKWIKKCQVHKNIIDSKLFETVLEQNHSFTTPATSEAEKIRIRNLGDPVENQE